MLRKGAEEVRKLAAPLWEQVVQATGVAARFGPTLWGPELLVARPGSVKRSGAQ